MHRLIIVLSLTATVSTSAQTDTTGLAEVKRFRTELTEEFKNPEKSPLEKKDRRKFKKHDFFTIDLTYRIEATLKKNNDAEFFSMTTTTDRLPEYRIFGMMEFDLNGKHYNIPVYQSKDLMKRLEYEDYLFFPFTDLTNDVSTYGGGRYIGLKIPKEGNKIIVDFNQAYNPYCAYNGRYSCPIVPEANHLDTEVRAGVKYDSKKYHH